MTAPTPGGLRRVLRILRKTVVALLALVAVALIVTLIAVHTSWGRDKIRGVIEDQLASTFAGGAKVRAFEGSILGDFTIEGIEIFDTEGKPAITIGTLRSNAALWKLGSKVAELEKLEIDDLSITLGKAPLTKPSTEPSSGEPNTWSVRLPEVIVRRGTVELRSGQPFSLDGVAITGAVAIPAGAPISATKLEVAATWREKKLPIVVTGGVEVGAGVSIPDAKIKVGELALVATGLEIDTQQPTGTVKITGSPEAIAAVVPQVELPAGLDVELVMKPSGRAADVTITGKFGDATVNGAIHGDLEKRTAAVVLAAGGVNLRRLLRSSGTRPPINVKGELALAVTADTKGVKGLLGVHGAARDLPESDATILVDATWKEAAVTILATGEGGAEVAVNAKAKRDGKKIAIDSARVVAAIQDLAPISGQRVALTAQQLIVDAKLSKAGTVAPAMDLVFDGTVRGARVSYDKTLVSAFDTSFGGSLRDKLYVQSTTRVRNVYQANDPMGSGTIAANLLPDGRIFTRVDLKPAMAAVGVVASAYITPGPVTTIALSDHVFTPQVGVPWSGRGGTITIDSAKDTVAVKEIVTASGVGGRARVDAKLVAGVLDASVDTQGLPLAIANPAYKGTVSGKLAVKRRGVRWDGGGTLTVAGIVIDPKAPVFDGDVTVAVAGRMVTLDAHAKSTELGGGRFELAVEGPRDITDFAAWKRLERTAIKNAVVTVDKVTLDAVSPSTGGKVEGKLRIAGVEVEGSIDVKSVLTPLGTAEGTVTFTPLNNDIYASWNAMLSDVGEANIGLRVRIPQHPFDPAAWTQLNRGVVQSLTASFDDIAVDPVKLAKLKITAPYSGRADVRLAIGSGASAATLDVDLRGIEGGALVKPVDLHAEVTTDTTGTLATACAARAKDPKGDACAKGGLMAASSAVKLLEVKEIKTPVTFDQWLADPKAALGSALTGTIAIPSQSAPGYLALVDRNLFDPGRGIVEGTIAIAGTLAQPTVRGVLAMKDMQLISRVEGRSIPALTKLEVSGGWDGTKGDVKISAVESNKGTLDITANLDPKQLAAARGTFDANKLDLAPLAAFLPGELAASQGELNGWIKVKSFDASISATGAVTISKADVPLDPMVGTLRNGELKLFSTPKGYSLDARGLLNGCRDPKNPRCTRNIRLNADAPLDLAKLDATLVADKVSTIGEIEPVIDGKAVATLTRNGREWTGDIRITGREGGNPSITVPKSTGDDLLDFEAPEDIAFTDKPPKQTRFGVAKLPTKAWLNARLYIASTELKIDEYDVVAAIVTKRPLKLLVGDAIGLDGAISVEYGNAADLFSRSYEIEQNDIVRFDGTIDPYIDLKLFHRFPELTLNLEIAGRLSDPDFPPKPIPTATETSLTWSDDQLFSIFFGADPSGSGQAQDVARGAGSSLLSQTLARKLKNVLPEKLQVLDYIGCEYSSAAAGVSCSAGKRLRNGRAYVALKHRVAPLQNENPEELLIQYYLSSEWYLEGTGGTASIVGSDLLWRRRW